MKSKELLWDIANKRVITLEEYISKIKKENITVVRAEDKAKYAICAYQAMLGALKAAQAHLREGTILQKIKNTVEVQDTIKEERNSIIEGINEVKKTCLEAMLAINKDDSPSIYERQTDTIEKYISDLTTQKLKIEADIDSLEQAKSTKFFMPVENLLISAPNITQLNIETPPKETFRYSWHGGPLPTETIIEKADALLKKAFYSPFGKVLGKRERESSASPKLKEEEIKSQKKKINSAPPEEKVNIIVNEVKEESVPKPETKITKVPIVEMFTKIEVLPKVVQEIPIKEKSLSSHKAENTASPQGMVKVVNKQEVKPFEMPIIEEFSVPKTEIITPVEAPIVTEVTPVKVKMPEAPVSTPVEVTNVVEKIAPTKNIYQDQCCYFLKPSTEDLYVYDIASKVFKKLKKVGQTKKIPLNFAMCVHQGKIFISGGDKEGASFQVTSAFNIVVADSSFSLTEIANMNLAKRQHTMISADQYIFTVGGFDSSVAKHLKACERYDGKNWEMMPEITRERRGITGVYHAPYIYAINGNCDTSILLFERMDIKACLKWEEVKVTCGNFTQRFLTAGISINNYSILLFGGYDKEVKKDAYVLDTDSMTLIKLNDLSKGDYFYQRTPAINSTAVYCAGNDKPIEIHMYDITTNKWTMSKVEG
jgi:hypothetical protein